MAATAVATEALKPAGKRGNNIAECEGINPDFFGLGLWPLSLFSGYVSTKEPVAQKGSENHYLVIIVEDI